MIDALFGSKTRVKLLHLFLNNPGQNFYVREITRKIDEQINSVRRELSNMLEVGVIISSSADNKLYYQVNQRYEHYVPLKTIFSNTPTDTKVVDGTPNTTSVEVYSSLLHNVADLRLAIFSGVLVSGSTAPLDILLVGNLPVNKVKTFIKIVEKNEGREINYSVLSYDEFYYRFSIRDRFISEILNSKYNVIIDKDKVLNKE